MDWWNLMKQSVTVGAQLLWGGCYGCNNGCYGCTIVMSYIEINTAVSQWLLTFNLCVSVTWPLTCAFHIPCTHTPEIIDMHRGVCDNGIYLAKSFWIASLANNCPCASEVTLKDNGKIIQYIITIKHNKTQTMYKILRMYSIQIWLWCRKAPFIDDLGRLQSGGLFTNMDKPEFQHG